MKTIIIFLVSAAALAADPQVMNLTDHFNFDGAEGLKNGSKRRTNEYRGYEVSIDAKVLVAKSESLYVYTSDLGFDGKGLVPIGLKKTPELTLEFDSLVEQDKESQAYQQRLAREGGGDPSYFVRKPKVEMWVLAKPAGFSKYVRTGGAIDNALVFEVTQICKKNGFKQCRPIRTEEEKGILSTFFGGK